MLVSSCLLSYYSASEYEAVDEPASILKSTFNSRDCDNPCWLGIEVGVTKRADVDRILQEKNRHYGVTLKIHFGVTFTLILKK
jgi:hypothetical protein